MRGRRTEKSINQGRSKLNNQEQFINNNYFGEINTTSQVERMLRMMLDDVGKKIKFWKDLEKKMRDYHDKFRAWIAPFDNGKPMSPSQVKLKLNEVEHLQSKSKNKITQCKNKNSKRAKQTQRLIDKLQKKLEKENSFGGANPNMSDDDVVGKNFENPITDTNSGNGKNGTDWGKDNVNLHDKGPSISAKPNQGESTDGKDNGEGYGNSGEEATGTQPGSNISQGGASSSGKSGASSSSTGGGQESSSAAPSSSFSMLSGGNYQSSLKYKNGNYYDFMMTVDIFMGGQGIAGAFFRHVDNFNTYGIEINPDEGSCSLTKILNGEHSVLQMYPTCGIKSSQWVTARIKVRGNNIVVNIYPYPGCPKPVVLKGSDSSITRGGVALMSKSNQKVNFMNFKTKVMPCTKLWEPNPFITFEPNTSDLHNEDFKGSMESKFTPVPSTKMEGRPADWRFEKGSSGNEAMVQHSDVNDKSIPKIPNRSMLNNKIMKTGNYKVGFQCNDSNGTVYIIFKNEVSMQGKVKSFKYYWFELTNEADNSTSNKYDLALKLYNNGVVKTLYSLSEKKKYRDDDGKAIPFGYKEGKKYTVNINVVKEFVYVFLTIDDGITYKLLKLKNNDIQAGTVGVGTNGTKCEFYQIKLAPNLQLPAGQKKSDFLSGNSDGVLFPDPIKDLDDALADNEKDDQGNSGSQNKQNQQSGEMEQKTGSGADTIQKGEFHKLTDGNLSENPDLKCSSNDNSNQSADSPQKKEDQKQAAKQGLENMTPEQQAQANAALETSGSKSEYAKKEMEKMKGKDMSESQKAKMWQSAQEKSQFEEESQYKSWYQTCIVELTDIKMTNYCQTNSFTPTGQENCKQNFCPICCQNEIGPTNVPLQASCQTMCEGAKKNSVTADQITETCSKKGQMVNQLGANDYANNKDNSQTLKEDFCLLCCFDYVSMFGQKLSNKLLKVCERSCEKDYSPKTSPVQKSINQQ